MRRKRKKNSNWIRTRPLWRWLFYALAGVICLCLVWLPPRLPGQSSGPATNTSALPNVFETNVVWEFRFTGNQVFSNQELGLVVQSYAHRPVTILDLEAARVALTTWYIDHGYVNSGAVMEQAHVTAGVFTYKIVEGRLSEINVQGNRWLRRSFYQSHLMAAGGDPLNINEVRDTLQAWRERYPVEQVNGEIQPGTLPGEGIMNLKVKERFPIHLGAQYDNQRPPPTGSGQVGALLRVDSLTGHADPWSLNYGIARGGDSLTTRPSFLGMDDLSTSYQIPFTARDTTLGFDYVRSSASVVEEPFAQLGIESRLESYGVTLSQPLFRRAARELTLSLSGERRAAQTFLLGTPYSFSPGAVNGRSIASVLRPSAQFVDRSLNHAFAARLSLEVGLDALDATRNRSGPDGRFVAVVAQTQYLRRLGQSHNQLLLRLSGQYTPDPLLSLEQLPLGGANTVRGYRENTLVRDKGVLGTAEFRLPLWLGKEGQPKLQLAPFADVGAGWNNGAVAAPFDNLGSMGIGMILTPCKHLEASIFWGHALRQVEYRSRDLQDDGLHFRLAVWAF